MKKTFLLIIALFFFAGCAGKNLITHGQVYENSYVSNEAGFSINTPVKWYPTLTPPSPDTEPKINAKLKRQRELGYMAKDDGTAYIIIETHWLTWGGRPIIPIDITWDQNGPEKLKAVCEKILSIEQKNSKDKCSSFTFECAKLRARDMCLIDHPCLESTKKMVSTRLGRYIIIEKVYIFGHAVSQASLKNLSADAHGWRVHFTLASPPDEYEQNVAAFEEVISSMQMK